MGPLIPVVMQLATLAPTLLRYFGAGEPTAAVAEQVVKVAQDVTGTSTPEAAIDALKANPDLVVAFQQRMVEIDAELEKAYLGDRADARKRDVAFLQAGQVNERANLMVLFDAVGLVACLVVLSLYRKDMPGEVIGLLSTIAGIFGLCLRDAHQFEFGSSRGSREKDQLLAIADTRGRSKP